MHFRRRHKREAGARGHSSDWRYPQTAKGSDKRGRVSAKRRWTAFEADLREWMKDPGFRYAYHDAADRITGRNRDVSGGAG